LVIDLVRRQDHWLVAAPQDLDHGFVQVLSSDGRIDDEDHGIRGRDGELHLLGDLGGHTLRLRCPPSGVHNDEGPPIPVGVIGDTIPGHSGDILHHGFAATNDPVDQR
jgi:hypothetical protein